MMDRIDLFHLPFYKKEAFTGSDRGIRFWIGKVTVGEEEEAQDYLRVTVWPEPYAWKHTPDEQLRSVKILRFQKKDWMKSMSGFWGMEEN